MVKDLSIISELEPVGLHQDGHLRVIEAAKRVRLLCFSCQTLSISKSKSGPEEEVKLLENSDEILFSF